MPRSERVDAVATHHRDSFRSGVGRFNELLAHRLGVPLVGLDELEAARHPLLSFKARELDDAGTRAVEQLLAGTSSWDLFLHEFASTDVERELVRRARRVLCGNREVEAQVKGLADDARLAFSPGLVLDTRPFPETDITVFSFGMAHKIRPDMFDRLKGLLDATGLSYAVYVSAANHEAVSLRDSADIFAEMHEIFPESLYFLGNVSDVAAYNWVLTTTFFVSFFEHGVRANNGSVTFAMEQGAVVITNMDGFSPQDLEHGENIIDIHRSRELPLDPEVLSRIGARAAETAHTRSWDALAELVEEP